ncbi:MAG: prephenate dehydratase [Bacteroidota bacterium]
MKVAIQGIEGSFHDQACRELLGNQASLVECSTFSEVFKTVDGEQASHGLIAIENSLVGTILSNYRLLRNSEMQVTGEVNIPIAHQLMALPGTSIDQISEVRSHPMALRQCRAFFEQHPNIRLIEDMDTASCAKHLAHDKVAHRAVVASVRAAELYGLEIIASGIQTHPENYTRFLLLEPKQEAVAPAFSDKASISFHVSHTVGTLAEVLQFIASCRMNLTKIQSLPLERKPWEYYFHLDMEYKRAEDFQNMLYFLKGKVSDLKVLGTYEKYVPNTTALQIETT